jgi:DNA polymerase
VLCCQLPSGRKLHYLRPEIRYKVKWDRKHPELYYYGMDEQTGQWKSEKVWGGVLTGHVVQSMARDLLVHSIFQVEEAGYETVLHLHDEILTERPAGEGSVADFEHRMASVPPWAVDIPVKVEAWSGDRWRK